MATLSVKCKDGLDVTVRVWVRNSGSGADLEDTRTASFTVSSGSATLRHLWRSTTGVALALFHHRHRPESPPPVTLAVRMRTHDDAGSGPVRYSFYSPEMNLIAETEPSTSATQTPSYEYVWFAGAPVAQIDTATSTTHWTFTDHFGTPQIETDAAGAVDWRAEYEPYGSVFAYRSGATRHQPLRFPGQEYDETVPNREYNIFRWYASGWGRYTQPDPVGLDGGLNVFAYVYDNPLAYIDPYGLNSLSDWCRSADPCRHRAVMIPSGGVARDGEGCAGNCFTWASHALGAHDAPPTEPTTPPSGPQWSRKPGGVAIIYTAPQVGWGGSGHGAIYGPQWTTLRQNAPRVARWGRRPLEPVRTRS